MDKVLIVDNQRFEKIHVASLSRGFEVLDGENAGRVKTGDMIRDIIGTYYNYTLTLEPDGSQESLAEYDQLYEIISSPEDAHYIRVPYGQENLNFRAYVTSGTDSLALATPDVSKWAGLEIKFIAMKPQRMPL